MFLISFRARVDICRLLMTFTNSLDPDQDVGPDLNPNLPRMQRVDCHQTFCDSLFYLVPRVFKDDIVLEIKHPSAAVTEIGIDARFVFI